MGFLKNHKYIKCFLILSKIEDLSVENARRERACRIEYQKFPNLSVEKCVERERLSDKISKISQFIRRKESDDRDFIG